MIQILQAIGAVLSGVILIMVTVAVLYLSTLIAAGIGIALLIYLAYLIITGLGPKEP